jgi:hypothetical protein
MSIHLPEGDFTPIGSGVFGTVIVFLILVYYSPLLRVELIKLGLITVAVSIFIMLIVSLCARK